MFKSLVKMFLPSSKKLAGMAAESIQKAINNQAEKEAAIAKYSQMADQAVDVSKKITTWLNDGRIDDMERDEIADEIKPLIAKILELI